MIKSQPLLFISDDNTMRLSIDAWINEAKVAADLALGTLAQNKDDKNAKLTELMLAIKDNYPDKTQQISAVFIVLDHLRRIEKEKRVLFHLFQDIYDGMLNCLASNSALFSSMDYQLRCGDDLLDLGETTFFVIFYKAIESDNYSLVSSFLDMDRSLRDYIIQDNKFKVCDGAAKKKLREFSPLILSAKNISASGLSIFDKVLSVSCSDYEYVTALLMLVKNKNESVRKAFTRLLSHFEINENRKKSFLKYLAKKDGKLLFEIAETGDIFFFGKILESYSSLPDTAITDITALQKDSKTLFQVFSARNNFQKSENLEITGYIGSGTYSFVFKGRIGNEREVAIKCCNPETRTNTLSDEFEILTKVKGSEYIISPVALIKTQQMLAIVLDFAAGDLGSFIKNNKLKVAQIPRIIIQLFAGLCVLHNNLIVYSDCKPENILVTAEGNVKLADFGLSVAYPDKETHLQVSGGTQLYRAPEIFAISMSSFILFNNAAPTDIYAAALIVWQIITGEKPFSNIHSSGELKNTVIAGNRPDVSRLTNFENLTVFTEKCWTGDLTERYNANKAYAEITRILSPQ